MDRRGFLGRLLAGAGALALTPQNFLWQPSPHILTPVAPHAIVGLDAMTKYLTQYVSERWSGRIVDGSMIGHGSLTSQLSVDAMFLPESLQATGLDPERYLDPIGKSLVQSLQTGRFVKFGKLPVDLPGASASRCTDPLSGISLRGLSQYDINWDHSRVRFDVLVGAA